MLSVPFAHLLELSSPVTRLILSCPSTAPGHQHYYNTLLSAPLLLVWTSNPLLFTLPESAVASGFLRNSGLGETTWLEVGNEVITESVQCCDHEHAFGTQPAEVQVPAPVLTNCVTSTSHLVKNELTHFQKSLRIVHNT